ncbi:type II secretion system F family protein [Frankia sp. AgB32]|uniref:type II secretion system F family protein n=1 Tax=Frankia sp. AgB32 TaxID=631119 RepID=UPI0020101D6F|nr:type II secretion system F family protein [Frankia sp. AgB32]MCK9895037.1 type II secretion system F family protein [Frankia sp. AgB32]
MIGPLTAAAAPALCGATAGGGLWLLGRSLRTGSGGAEPRGDSGIAAAVARWLTRVVGPTKARRLLLAEDLAVLGVDLAHHTVARMIRISAALGVVATMAVLTAASGHPLPTSALLLGCVGALPAGLGWADRPLRRRAGARRQEVRLAVAAYLDLVRILLIGGLPLHTALQTAADTGRGWAFTQLRLALRWAWARQLPPDAGLDRLARQVPVAEFAELRLTISTALRGASPVGALRSKSAHLRAAEAAHARLTASTADAAMELPAVVVALAFVAFLTIPLLVILTGIDATP